MYLSLHLPAYLSICSSTCSSIYSSPYLFICRFACSSMKVCGQLNDRIPYLSSPIPLPWPNALVSFMPSLTRSFDYNSFFSYLLPYPIYLSILKFSLSVSHSLTLSLSYSLSHTLYLSLSNSLALYLFYSLLSSLSLSLSLSFSLSLSLILSLSHLLLRPARYRGNGLHSRSPWQSPFRELVHLLDTCSTIYLHSL